MIKALSFLVIACALVARSNGQWPLGNGFLTGMDQMMRNMNNMAVNMQAAGTQMAMQRQTLLDEDIRRSWQGVPFETSGSVFITYDGGLGYAYNSTDGSFTLYSLRPGSPPSGYMYHKGAQGGTTFNSW